MSFNGEEAKLTILLGTIIILLFGIALIALLSIFNKKSQLNQKEKEILRSTYEKMILQSQLEIQEQTFSDISGELHDNVGQVLSLAKVQINIMNESENLNKDMMNAVKDNIGKALIDLRDIAKGLNTERIRNLSLYDTVAHELIRVSKTGVTRTSIHKEGAECPLDDQKKLILFRIIQESIQNCIKHAEASEIQVIFTHNPSEITVQVKDNGKGFTPTQDLQKEDGLGLMNMKKRACLAGGLVTIETKRQEGTTVNISIPYE